MTERLVVIGGGQAAAHLIESARDEGYAGEIVLVSDEAVAPYQRPPLSKQYLSGKYGADWLLYRPLSFYETNAVTLRLGVRAEAIDRATRRVHLSDGASIDYDRLGIVTGARALKLDVPGADLPHIHYIRTLADVDGLRADIAPGRRVVVVGAGFIGLEAAAMLVQIGLDTTLLARQDRLLSKLAAPEISSFLLDHHLMHGVKVRLNTQVAEFRLSGQGLEVVCDDGAVLGADLVIAGIGAAPNVELAQACGLDCDNGILVDEEARTSDPAIVSAGDCTNHPNPLVGGRLRLETVHNAVEQGRTAGATVAGKALPYIQSPWVWSDQFKLRLQSVGMADGADVTVMRGTPASGRFSLFYYRGDQLLAVNTVNQPAVFASVRRLLNEQIALPPGLAADENFPINSLLPRRARLVFDIPWPTKLEKAKGARVWGHG